MRRRRKKTKKSLRTKEDRSDAGIKAVINSYLENLSFL
jgi:hypothetical protein